MGNLGPNGEELDPWEDIHGRMWPLAETNTEEFNGAVLGFIARHSWT
jgi:hypothetical protein